MQSYDYTLSYAPSASVLSRILSYADMRWRIISNNRQSKTMVHRMAEKLWGIHVLASHCEHSMQLLENTFGKVACLPDYDKYTFRYYLNEWH